MIGNLVRRLVELAVMTLAGYAFFFVPIGRKTPYRHLVAVFSTEPAREAADDFRNAGTELGRQLIEESKALTSPGPDGGRSRHN